MAEFGAPQAAQPFPHESKWVTGEATMRSTSILWSVAFLLGMAPACIPRKPAGPTHPAQQAPAVDPNAKPEFELSPAELERKVAQLTDGYSASATYSGSLEDFKALELELVRGQCYVLVMRLGPGASFGAHARRGVAVATAYELEDLVTHDDLVVGPGVVLDAGCPLVNGHLVVDLQATWDKEKDTTRFHELGSGSYEWTLYSSPISEDELKALTEAAVEGTAPPASGSTAASADSKRDIQFENDCSKRVSLFFGNDPKSGRGDMVSLGGHAKISKALRVGDSVWLMDGQRKGMGIVNVTEAIHRITVAADCISISGR